MSLGMDRLRIHIRDITSGAAEATGLGFVCFFVIHSRVLSANRVDFKLFCFINFPISLSLSLSPSPSPSPSHFQGVIGAVTEMLTSASDCRGLDVTQSVVTPDLNFRIEVCVCFVFLFMLIVHIVSSDRFSLCFSKENRSRLIPVTVCLCVCSVF